jgi:hypothetical protein
MTHLASMKLTEKKWIEAIDGEIHAIEKNDT